MLREVQIHGALGETFRLDVASPVEAVRALITLRPHLRQYFHDNDWHVVIGRPDSGYAIDAGELALSAGHQPIHFMPVVSLAGGRGMAIGKVILGAVLIATAIFFPPAAIMAGGTLAAVGITQSAVIGLGISMLLGGIAQLIAPVPKGPRLTDNANPEERPSFFFNGPTNVSEQGVPVPLAYGFFRVGSIVVNAGLWNEDVAADEVEGGATRIGDRVGDGPPLLARALAGGDWPVLRAPVVLEKGGGKGGTPGAAYAPREAPNTLRSRSLVRLHEILCEGPIQGPPTVDWGKYVYFDNTPLQAANKDFNFMVSASYLRTGLPQETPIPGFPAGEAVYAVGSEVLKDTPVVRRVNSTDTTMIRLNIRVPQLMKQENNGDVNPAIVDVRIEYQVEGQPWTKVIDNRIEGKTTSGYERTISFFLPPRPGDEFVDIRVSRLTDDSDKLQLLNETWWSSFTEIVEGTLRHDDTAAVAFSVDAEQFPSIPKRSYEFKWLIVSVPTNYDPATRTYSGDWDGTFKQAWTDNPAWILYDLLTHTKHGLGRDLGPNLVDKWSFYEAAVWNDGMVEDGIGGLEPRFTYNGILNTTQEAATVLQSVAGMMRAQFYAAGGTIFLAQDRPSPSFARVLSIANVEHGIFDYQSQEVRSRVTHCNVIWVDPDDQWQGQVEPVPYPEMMGRYGYREIQIAAMGCTRRGQSIRHGRYFLFSAHHEQETVSFTVGLENADLRPGDLIAIQDSSRAAVSWAGRVVSRSGSNITLDRKVPGGPGGTLYLATTNVPQGSEIRTGTVANWPAQDVITVGSGVDLTDIGKDSIWAISNPSVNLTQWRVLSVSEQEGFRFQITAAFHDPRKYTFVEEGVLLPERSYDALPKGPLKPPIDLKVKDYYSIDPTGAPRAGLVFSWNPPPDPRVIQFIADAIGPGKIGEHWPTVPGTSVILLAAQTGQWKMSVISADAIGRKSLAASIVVNTAALARVPLPPINFHASQSAGQTALLTWSLPDDLSISYWVLKWTPDLAVPSWDAATFVQRIIPRRLLSIVVPAQTGAYLLKSVSVRSVECKTPAIARLSVADLRPIGIFRTEQPTWDGTRTNCDVELGELVLHGPPAMAYHEARRLQQSWPPPLAVPFPFKHYAREIEAIAAMEYITPVLALTQNAQYTSRVTLQARGVIAADLMINWVPLSVAVPLSRTASADWDALVEERYASDSAAGPWSEWGPAGQATIQAQWAQFRLLGAVYAVGVDVKVSRMEEALMLAPHEQSGSATTNASGVVSIALDPDYYTTPVVSVQQTGATPVQLIVTAASGTAFTVNSFTAAGAVAPNVAFTWRVLGYGRTP